MFIHLFRILCQDNRFHFKSAVFILSNYNNKNNNNIQINLAFKSIFKCFILICKIVKLKINSKQNYQK